MTPQALQHPARGRRGRPAAARPRGRRAARPGCRPRPRARAGRRSGSRQHAQRELDAVGHLALDQDRRAEPGREVVVGRRGPRRRRRGRRRTPPTSTLWRTSGQAVFSTTGYPRRSAAATADSGVPAATDGAHADAVVRERAPAHRRRRLEAAAPSGAAASRRRQRAATTGRSACARRCPRARSPDRVPSSTGMPVARSRRPPEAGRSPMAGWRARRPACRCARRACSRARGNESSPSYSGTRSTASATTSTDVVVGQGGEAAREQVLRARSGAPDVERVGRLQARFEQRGEPGASSPSTASRTGRRARSATSATRTRSAPESCTVAIPPPERRRTRRPIANISRLSASSPRSSHRCTPYAANSASQAASEPARAPECASTSALPLGGATDGERDHRDVALGGVLERGSAAPARPASSPGPGR